MSLEYADFDIQQNILSICIIPSALKFFIKLKLSIKSEISLRISPYPLGIKIRYNSLSKLSIAYLICHIQGRGLIISFRQGTNN